MSKTTQFDTAPTLFAAVREHKLERKASLIAWGSYDGALVGFSAADTKGPSPRWVMARKALKAALRAATEQDEQGWLRKMLSYQGRRELIPWIRGEDAPQKPAKKSNGSKPKAAPLPPPEPDVDLSDQDVFNLLMEQED